MRLLQKELSEAQNEVNIVRTELAAASSVERTSSGVHEENVSLRRTKESLF